MIHSHLAHTLNPSAPFGNEEYYLHLGLNSVEASQLTVRTLSPDA
jgi:hypothetical protein